VSSQDISTWIAIRRHDTPSQPTSARPNSDRRLSTGEAVVEQPQLPTPGISKSPEPMLPTPISPTFPCSPFVKSEPSPPSIRDDNSAPSREDQSPMIAFARHIVPPSKYQSFITSNGPPNDKVSPSRGSSHTEQHHSTRKENMTSCPHPSGNNLSTRNDTLSTTPALPLSIPTSPIHSPQFAAAATATPNSPRDLSSNQHDKLQTAAPSSSMPLVSVISSFFHLHMIFNSKNSLPVPVKPPHVAHQTVRSEPYFDETTRARCTQRCEVKVFCGKRTASYQCAGME